MPLFENAVALIRRQLEEIQNGNRVKAFPVGTLTPAQLGAINAVRHQGGYAPIIDEVLFLGQHVYGSRVVKDGYCIEDVIGQIVSAMDMNATVIATQKMTAMQNLTLRTDRYGNRVRDRVVLECTTRHPRPELYSVIPKGDVKKPKGPP